ncbi:MAG TPA: hypothetical protein PKA64_21415, partial [Myxococcota bacterium]|nr:hypothetical protein [Myxococcota bacterium]
TCDVVDPCPLDASNGCQDPCLMYGGDADGDGICDAYDPCPGGDADGDGTCDVVDPCPLDASNGCQDPCLMYGGDADGDGICDAYDPCAGYGGDADGDGTCDAYDPCSMYGGDADGDGVCDAYDPCAQDASNGCLPDDTGRDTAGDTWRDTDVVVPDTYVVDTAGWPVDDTDAPDDSAAVDTDAPDDTGGVVDTGADDTWTDTDPSVDTSWDDSGLDSAVVDTAGSDTYADTADTGYVVDTSYVDTAPGDTSAGDTDDSADDDSGGEDTSAPPDTDVDTDVDTDTEDSDVDTAETGAAADTATYISRCKKDMVPIPPPWGDPAWKNEGQLTQIFAGRGKTELWTATVGQGQCASLPRYAADGTTVRLFGQICTNLTSGKTCFWDNVDPANAGARVGVPNGYRPRDGLGGDKLDENCTACHRGENPWVKLPTEPTKVLRDPAQAAWTPVDPQKGWDNGQNPGGPACGGCHDVPNLTQRYCGIALSMVNPPNGGLRAMPPPVGMPPAAANLPANWPGFRAACTGAALAALPP